MKRKAKNSYSKIRVYYFNKEKCVILVLGQNTRNALQRS